MRALRWGMAASVVLFASCGTEASPSALAPDAAAPDVSEVDTVASDVVAQDTAGPDVTLEVMAPDVSVSDVSDVSGWDTEASSFLEMTVGQETSVLVDQTFVGYAVNEFGAEVYGNMLKIWIRSAAAGLEILVRTDQTTIPGEVQPGVPGQEAWVLLMVGEDDVFTTQMPSGSIGIDTCPSEVGTLVSGTLTDVVVLSMGTMAPAKLNGSFDVVLGRVTGEAICSGL